MRVALVVAGPYPALRGSQVLVRQLERGLGARGHDVDVIAYGVPDGVAPPGPRPARLLHDIHLVARLWRHVRRHATDVIHAHNYEGAVAGLVVARALGRPLIYHGHSALAEELPTWVARRGSRRALRAVGRLLDRLVPCRADYCIAVTEELGRLLEEAGVAMASLDCIVPAGGEDVGPPPRSYGGTEPTALVCYAGNLDGYQNLGFLQAVFARVRARLPEARLMLVTHDPRPVRHVGRLVDGVDLVAAPSYDAVRRRLEAAHVVVCPRIERSGFPMKLLNYMAAGKAIVACAGSAKGLIDGVNGRVVADGDVGGFAAAIGELLGDASVRARLGAAARQAVDDPRAWEHALDRIERIYRLVLEARQPAVVPVAVPE